MMVLNVLVMVMEVSFLVTLNLVILSVVMMVNVVIVMVDMMFVLMVVEGVVVKIWVVSYGDDISEV